MAIKIGIFLLLLLGIALAALFFVLAGLLFFAPELLLGTLRTGMAVGCLAGGALLFVPVLVFAVLYLSGRSGRAKEKPGKAAEKA